MNRDRLLKRFRVEKGKHFRLRDFDPAETADLESAEDAAERLEQQIVAMSELQDMLYAQDCWSVLLIFQAMDAAGKDSIIKHVMSGLNPQGCQVYSFKAPSEEELDHDFLWRAQKVLPRRGDIGIFNRSYYEEVLVVRVHPEKLEKERLPHRLVTRNIWKERFGDINAFEYHLAQSGTLIRKFFLNVSRREQKTRFLARLKNPEKNWKLTPDDVFERAPWDKYMSAYEDMIAHTASKHAPWFIVPADNKWFTRVVVAEAILHALESLDLAYPTPDRDKNKALKAARAALKHEKR